MEKNYIYILIRKFFENNLSKEMQLRFRSWLVNDVYQTEKEKAMEDIWENDSSVANHSTLHNLQQMHQRMHKLPATTIFTVKNILIAAAMLVLPFLGAGVAYQLLQRKYNGNKTELVECFVPNGSKKHFVLPDGSEVWLNAGSVLIYPEKFTDDTRTLYLGGEAFFNVKKNPAKPFIVKTQHVAVQALGTAFNVSSYPDSYKTITTLEEGKVRVDSKDGDKKSVTLLPDQQSTYDSKTGFMTKMHVDASRVSRWKEGYLFFQGVSFNEIVKTLERRFNITVNYEDSKYAGRTFTVKFNPDEGLIQVMDVLKEMVVGLQYRMKDNVLYIY